MIILIYYDKGHLLIPFELLCHLLEIPDEVNRYSLRIGPLKLVVI